MTRSAAVVVVTGAVVLVTSDVVAPSQAIEGTNLAGRMYPFVSFSALVP